MRFKHLIKNNKKILSLLLIFVISIGVFGVFDICFAQEQAIPTNLIEGGLLKMVGGLAQLIVWICGIILSQIIAAIISITSYNSFINEPDIINGWKIVRDLCNMFFVLILLVIAFATILKIESYNVKKLLPKLLIMAVLINFSRTICGLAIDFSQVIMLTFVNAFSDSGGQFTATLQVHKFLSASTDFSDLWTSSKDLNATNTLGSIFIAIGFMVVSTITMVAILIVFLMRMIMFWIYIVLSPLAFLLSSFPVGQKYAAQYWGEFTKYLINGPVLAFFIWLSLITVQNFDTSTLKTVMMECTTEIMCLPNFIGFLIAIGFLVGGLIVSQQIGGMGASWGANAVSGLKTRGLGLAKGAAKLGAKAPLGLAGWGARKLKAGTGVELRPTKIIAGIKEAFEDKKRKEEIQGESKSAAALREGGIGGLIKGLGASKDMAESMAHGAFYRHGWKLAGKTMKAPKIRKEIQKLEDQKKSLINKDGKITDQGAYEEVQQKLQKAEEQLQTPYTFHAEQNRNTLVREAMGKIGDNDNEDDLIAMFNDAMSRGDKEMAAAVMVTAAKVGHLNEIIQSQKATENVKDERGKVVIKKGEYLDQSGYGLNALVNQQLIGKLHMSDQEAYSHQSTASSLAKSVGHFNLSESVGVKNGLMFQRSVSDQKARARGELRKVDSEKAIRNYNRLAWGDEIQYEKGGKTKRDFKLNELGKANFVEWADKISKEIDLKRFQKNAAMNISRDKEGLKNFIQDLKNQGITEYKDEDTNKMVQYSTVAEKLITYGKSVADAEEAVGRLSSSAVSGSASAKKGKTKSAEAEKKDEAEPIEMENPALNKPKS